MSEEQANELEETTDIIVMDAPSYLAQPMAATTDRDMIREMSETLMLMHPNAEEIGIVGMRNIAQLAAVTGANPLPGSNGIHAWRDKKGKLNISLGIDYWRSQAEQEGGVLWIDPPRAMNEEERKEYGVKLEGQLASICTGCLKKNALELLREMKDLGLPMTLAEAKVEVSRTGVGTVNAQEYAKAGRPQHWSGDKRAEMDLLRMLLPTLRNARKNLESGEHVKGGQDWSITNYAPEYAAKHDPRLAAPEGYSAEDATADLIDYDNPDERPGTQVIPGKPYFVGKRKTKWETVTEEGEIITDEEAEQRAVEAVRKIRDTKEQADDQPEEPQAPVEESTPEPEEASSDKPEMAPDTVEVESEENGNRG